MHLTTKYKKSIESKWKWTWSFPSAFHSLSSFLNFFIPCRDDYISRSKPVDTGEILLFFHLNNHGLLLTIQALILIVLNRTKNTTANAKTQAKYTVFQTYRVRMTMMKIINRMNSKVSSILGYRLNM